MSLANHLSEMSQWCARAAGYVRFPPDRARVREELWCHMDDAETEREASGMPREAAVAQTVRAMGDPDEVGRALAKVHPAWKGYLWISSVACLWICIFAFVIPVLVNSAMLGSIHNWLAPNDSDSVYDMRFAEGEGMEGTETLLAYWEPSAKAASDGYTFSVTRAAHRRNTASGEDILYFSVRATHPLPWAGYPKAAGSCFSGKDSAGHTYVSSREYSTMVTDGEDAPAVPRVWGLLVRRTFFSYEMEYTARMLSPDAEWFELFYQQDGRTVVLRFPVKGEAA